MKVNRKGGIAMALVIFVGGMFLGFSLGFATMAMVAARDRRFQSEPAQALEGNPACAYSPMRKFRPVRLVRPPATGVWVTPQP
jgi:hypothetical protein